MKEKDRYNNNSNNNIYSIIFDYYDDTNVVRF